MTKHRPEFPWKTLIALLAIFSACLYASGYTFIQALRTLLLPNQQQSTDQTAIMILKESSDYIYFHLGAFLSGTFILGIMFKGSSEWKWLQTWILVPVSWVAFGFAAYFFFQAETCTDLLNDADKPAYFHEIIMAKLGSLVAATFCGGLSFEMTKKVFMDSD